MVTFKKQKDMIVTVTEDGQKPFVPIDWSKKQFVKSTDNQIVLTTGNHTQQEFEGIAMKATDPFGDIWDSYVKAEFTLYTGRLTLTLENE